MLLSETVELQAVEHAAGVGDQLPVVDRLHLGMTELVVEDVQFGGQVANLQDASAVRRAVHLRVNARHVLALFPAEAL
ncbi:hypothetical protein D3C80_1539420 [compost metagenome]